MYDGKTPYKKRALCTYERHAENSAHHFLTKKKKIQARAKNGKAVLLSKQTAAAAVGLMRGWLIVLFCVLNVKAQHDKVDDCSVVLSKTNTHKTINILKYILRFIFV